MDASLSSNPPKSKPKKPYRQHYPPKKSSSTPHTAPPTITPGDTGIWATCTKGKEGKATLDLLDLFARYAESLYGIHDNIAPAPTSSPTTPSNTTTTTPPATHNPTSSPPPTSTSTRTTDIETSIAEELALLRPPTTNPHTHPSSSPSSPQTPTVPATPKPPPLIQPIRLTTPCLLFFRTAPPLDPIAFTTAICRAATHSSRFVKRLTPIALTGKASLASVTATAARVLGDAGMTAPTTTGGTFAIRPTVRNNHTVSRTGIIEAVAPLVGRGWTVDLTRPARVVLVEVWQAVSGVAVVPGVEYDRLKRFNLAELGGERGKTVRGGDDDDGEEVVVGGGGGEAGGNEGEGAEVVVGEGRGGGGEGEEDGGGKRKWDGGEGEDGRVAKSGRGGEEVR